MGNAKDYLESVRRGSVVPKDPFTHAQHLLDPEKAQAKSFGDIVEKSALLANVGSDSQIGWEKEAIFHLNHMHDMYQRDPKAIGPMYMVCLNAWKGGLAITRAKNGKERLLQALVGSSGFSPALDTEGFGASLDAALEPREAPKNPVREALDGLKGMRGGQRRRYG